MDPYCAEVLPFVHRTAAGEVLGRRLLGTRWPSLAIVLALSRSSVPVAKAVANVLQLPLDLLVVQKIRHPDQPGLAIGAVAAGGVVVKNRQAAADVPAERFDALAAAQRAEANERERRYRCGREPLSLDGRTAILVADGLATGATMRAALSAARLMNAYWLVAASPVGSRDAVAGLAQYADRVVCPYRPDPFQSVGMYYADFARLGETEVREALAA